MQSNQTQNGLKPHDFYYFLLRYLPLTDTSLNKTTQKSNCFKFNFDHSYSKLPDVFFKKQAPVAVIQPELIIFNDTLGLMLGLDVVSLKTIGAPLLAGNTLCPGSEPIAQAYAGHQFGHFNMLGDGRAILLGEHITPTGQKMDIQLKGSGRTPYSRSGDGRAALGPMLREYIISEAMQALGIPTTRSLAVTATGEPVYREMPNPGAILTRVAASHIRVGTFQFAAATQNKTYLQALADYTIQRHFPALAREDHPYLALLDRVIDLQASLIAQWMLVGFIHGVMNTDNMSISGETIDYGPCAFMNNYHPDTVFSSIDTQGRYAYGNQPNIAHWNLVRLAEALLPLIHDSEETAIEMVTASLNTFPQAFQEDWLTGMRKKLGMFNEEADDHALVQELLNLMQQYQSDYTNTFRRLSSQIGQTKPLDTALEDAALDASADYQNWLAKWQSRLSRQTQSFAESAALMHSVNPKVIPRNHLVEEALAAAVQNNDLAPLHALLAVLAQPYAETNHAAQYTTGPVDNYDQQYRTFCGT
jgi:uncharacterized protein YdiU (UPF0061 family)